MKWEYSYGASDAYTGHDRRSNAKRAWIRQLNQLGTDGWELVAEQSMTGTQDGHSWVQWEGTLKRPAAKD